MAKVFHVLTPEERDLFIKEDTYHPASLDSDGFIHLSRADQIYSVIQNFYATKPSLILWRLAESSFCSKLIYEPPLEAPNSGIKFPHYYKEINISWNERTFSLEKVNDRFILPKDLLE